ncbi:alpha/beta fold hydrolase [Kitasatospora aburaviensis]
MATRPPSAATPPSPRSAAASSTGSAARRSRPTPPSCSPPRHPAAHRARPQPGHHRPAPRVQAPTLVIGCGQDATIPVENTRRLHAAIAGSEYAEFDTGHVVVFEQAEAFTSTVRDFLAAA